MRGILACLALSGCVAKHSPKPSDTEFNEDKRDWTAVYQEEIRIAMENEDFEARYFFLQEIIKLRYKMEYNQDLPANPRIQILK